MESVIDLNEVSRLIDLPRDARDLLENPGQEIRTKLNVIHDGKLLHADAFSVMHCTARGPGKGGILISADVDLAG